jgi:hypothetical protein
LWHIDPLLGNAHNTHAANSRGTVFSVVRARTVAMQRTRHVLAYVVTSPNKEEAVSCCGSCQVIVRDNRRGVFYVVRAMPSAGQRANMHAFWHMIYVFCAAWFMSRLYKGASLKGRRNKRVRIQRCTTEWELSYR